MGEPGECGDTLLTRDSEQKSFRSAGIGKPELHLAVAGGSVQITLRELECSEELWYGMGDPQYFEVCLQELDKIHIVNIRKKICCLQETHFKYKAHGCLGDSVG